MTTHQLSQRIDIPAFYSRYSRVVGKPTNSRSDGKEYHGSCPRCGGNDRFSFWSTGRFSCSLRSSGCGIHGSSPYWFLRDVEGMTHRQACEELDIDPDQQLSKPFDSSLSSLPLFMTRDDPPPPQWQSSAEAFLHRAERYLWTKAPAMLSYLHSRGFTDDTIRNARLGYCPGWYSDALSNWGLLSIQTENQTEIKIPEGLVIPWFVSSKIWKLSIRRPAQGYFQVLGSSDALYNIDSFSSSSKQPIFLFESELDALSALQEAPDLAAHIATGGASKALSARWIARLLEASHVFISFDQDANHAGDTGAQEWLRILPHALRWQPWSKDANQMLSTGLPVRMWIETALSLSTLHISLPSPSPQAPTATPPVAPALIIPSLPQRRPTWLSGPTNERGLPLLCSICYRSRATAWAAECQPYCEKCWSNR